MEYQIIRFTKENIDFFQKLFFAVYNKKLNKYEIEHKYEGTSNLSYLGYFACIDHQPIAFYGAIPMVSEINGEIKLSVQSTDAMTLPAYRSLGIFYELGKAVYKTCKECGADFAWAFTNQNSEKASLKHGILRYSHRMIRYEWILIKGFMEYLVKVRSLLFSNHLKHFSHHLDSISEFPFGSFIKQNTILHDRAYWDKKKQKGAFSVKFGNTIFIIKPSFILLIGDVWTNDTNSFEKDLDAFLNHCKKGHYVKVVFQSSSGSSLSKLLEKSAHSIHSSWAILINPFNIDFNLDTFKVTLMDIDSV